MGTISEKLVYLNGTKQAIKQAINEDFEVIDDNTTFREYADEISSNNAKYKDLIPKETKNATNTLDISNSSGLDKALVTQYGNTYQETTTGKNLLNTSLERQAGYSTTINGITFTINEDNTITANGTVEGTENARFTFIDNTSILGTNKKITSQLINGEINGQCSFFTYDDTYGNARSSQVATDGSVNNTALGTNIEYTKFRLTVYAGTIVNNAKIGLMVIDTSETDYTYEPYTNGASPNPDYPQEIVNISSKSVVKIVGKNKLPFPYTQASSTSYGVTFTVQNDGSVLVNGTANGGNGSIKLYGDYLTIDNKELPGKYISGGTNEVNLRALNNIDGSYTLLANDTGNGAEINTSTYKKGYIELFVRNGTTVNNQIIKPMVLDSLDDTTYEAYKEQSFDLDLKSKNLFDISKVERNVYYNYGTTGSVPTIATSDKRITLSPTNSIKVKPSTQYTLSFPSAFRYAIAEMENNYISLGDSGWKTNTTYTFTTSATTNYIGFNFSKTDNSTITDNDWNTFINSGIQLEENSTATEYEPYYDINLCKIGDYKDRIYKSTGKNLFDKNNANILNAYINGSSGIITTDNNSRSIYIQCKPNTTYTIQKILTTRFRVGYSSDTPVIGTTLSGVVSNYEGTNITITTDNNAKYLVVWVCNIDTSTLQKVLDSIQIEESSTASEYEPFGKVWYLEKKIGKISFSDSDLNSCSTNGITSAFVEYLSPIIDDIKPGMSEASQVSFSNITNIFRGTTSTKKIRFRISHEILGTTSASTNAETKTALLNKMSDKTMICYYVLATPTTEEITESNYPTLYNQLNNIKLFEGVNHITMTNESGLDVEFDIEYYKDWKLD